MCVKLLLGDLNPNPYPLHPTNTYTYRVIIAPRVCDGVVEVVSVGDWLILAGGWWW